MAVRNQAPATGFPEGDEFRSHVSRRRRWGTFWRTLFLLSTTVGVVALSALLLNIGNDAFGYVAIQNKIDPETLLLKHYKEQMLAAPRQVTSEDDEKLAAGVAARPMAIGFFGYAYYQEHADELKLVPVDGISPSAASVESGEYLLSRPLYLYSTQEILVDKDHVAAFIYYYLSAVTAQISQVGYFPMSPEAQTQALETWQRTTGLTPTTVDDLLPVTGDISTLGSSTVASLTQRMADGFKALGYTGNISVDATGTEAGFQAFCVKREGDIVNASTPINRLHRSACQKIDRVPLEFRVGTDGVAVVVSKDNDFVTGLTTGQMQKIFTTAETWKDVDPNWPDKPILRFIPGAESGTLDFFVTKVWGSEIEKLPTSDLKALLVANVKKGRLRALESKLPLDKRADAELRKLVQDEILQAQIVLSWSLLQSIFHKTDIEAEVAAVPNAQLEFRSWVNPAFLTSPQSSDPESAGIRTAILGSLFITLLTLLVAMPVGVGAAVYLEEYGGNSWYNRLIETNINNLAGVPSIIYGLLGLAVFVRALEPFSSGAMFGTADPATANGRTIVAAALTLALLILPLIIINAREAIRAVSKALREASYALGATKWQTIWNHVLPNAIPGILTGSILAISRAFGETAPLVVIGAATFIVIDPNSPFSKFTTLPIQIYQWTSRPQEEFKHLAAAAILVLLVLLLALNATAIWLRNRYSQRTI